MDPFNLRKEVVRGTLNYISLPNGQMVTGNDDLHTFLWKDVKESEWPFPFQSDELPILKCDLGENRLQITTTRIVSLFKGKSYGLELLKVEGIGQDFEKGNYSLSGEPLPKTNIITIEDINGGKLYYEIDSYYPAFFSKLLIVNLSKYLREGKWAFFADKMWGE